MKLEKYLLQCLFINKILMCEVQCYVHLLFSDIKCLGLTSYFLSSSVVVR